MVVLLWGSLGGIMLVKWFKFIFLRAGYIVTCILCFLMIRIEEDGVNNV